MVIEWLKFRISPAHRQHFLEADRAVWTATVAGYPGFLGKQVWSPPQEPEILVIIVQWASRAVWQAVPGDRIEAIGDRVASP